jgi:Viral BACON domain
MVFASTRAAGADTPTLTVDKAQLNFGATTGFLLHTGSQTIRLTQSGAGSVSWAAVSNVPWLIVSPTAGTGSATLTVSIVFEPFLPTPPATVIGSISINTSSMANAAGPIGVRLNLINPQSDSSPAFGSFDTPTDGAAGLAGSIAVTGWVLDEIQVTTVNITRLPVAGETQGNDVIVGDATLIDGARPDVAALYPQMPFNTRAGWGYLLLTNMLPNQGNGSFTLRAFAGGTFLGAKTITVDNADSVAPFGAIDTPAQGAVVSGVVTNFGWVLSPGARRSDPPGGGTVTVYVDGAPVGSPGGWTSRSDLSGLFPVSQYAGVETALGVFGLDTTTLANGVHTIAWVVTDTLGVTSGVGSRFFTVSNSSSVLAGARAASAAASGVQADDRPIDVGDVSPPPVSGAGSILVGRVGFDLGGPQQYFFPGAAGVVTIRAQELDRIELQLEPGATGVQITPQGEAPLPAGVRIDPATGVFTWAPGAGFIGAYDFVFGSQRVRIVIRPKAGV